MPSCFLRPCFLALICISGLVSGLAQAAMVASPLIEGQDLSPSLPAAESAYPLPVQLPLWVGLSPEQREQMRSQIRNYHHHLSPEERQRRGMARRERWEKMTPEEKQRLRERIQEHHRQREEVQSGAPKPVISSDGAS